MTTATGTAVSAIRQESRREHGVPAHRIPVCRPPSTNRDFVSLHHLVINGRSRCQSAGQRSFDPIRTQLMGRTHPIIVAHNHRESPVGAPDDSSNATTGPVRWVSPTNLALAEHRITLDPTVTTTRVRVCTSVGAAVRVPCRCAVDTTPSPHDSVEQGEARENIQAAFGACPRRDTREPHGLRRGLWRRRRRWQLG